ncbi:tetraspanin-33-like [Crassostrea virginica]
METLRRTFRRRGPKDYSKINPLLKYFLFFENVLIWLVGLAMTAIGAYVLYIKDKVVKDAFDFFLDPATLMTTGGAIIVFITFFGCMGALRENTCFLKTYNYILSFFFLGEMALIILIFVFYYVPESRDKLGIFPKDSLSQAIDKYGVEDDDDMVNLIDNIQKTLQCCGLADSDDGYKDWSSNDYYHCNKSNKSPEACSVPYSCCKIKPGEEVNILCGRNVMKEASNGQIEAGPTISRINKEGCVKALGTWIQTNAMVLGGILLGILLPQMFIMCMSRTLRDQIKFQKSKWNRPSRFHDNRAFERI